SLLRPPRGRNRSRDDIDPGAAIARRLNGILNQAGDVVIARGAVAPPGFDARFSALWRRYEYRIADASATRDPLRRLSTTWLPARLDVEPMDAAAAALCGLHDFAAYCKPRVGAT
ncbi:tRNA pseudouridine synthase A, partial [Rhizobium johnstonii]